MYGSIAEAARDAEAQGKTLAQVALEMESRDQGRTIEDIRHALGRALAVQEVNAAMGVIVVARASRSGAEGGCQAETGAAAGMAAGAAPEMLGGTPSQCSHVVALAQQGTLGLVCDPLGGLVELPCVFRNATGAAIALAAIEMALAGITFAIQADEVIDTMGEIGREMDVRYRETAGGGLAATPTGQRLAKERLVQVKRGWDATPAIFRPRLALQAPVVKLSASPHAYAGASPHPRVRPWSRRNRSSFFSAASPQRARPTPKSSRVSGQSSPAASLTSPWSSITRRPWSCCA